MGTANFNSKMDFPLIVSDDLYMKRCPKCGLGQDPENEVCDECGASLVYIESEVDEGLMSDLISEMEKIAEKLNSLQKFYTVSVESGHYSGVQFFVEDNFKDDDFYDWDAEDLEAATWYSDPLEAQRAQHQAKELIEQALVKSKSDLGLIELGSMGRFSNGEEVYTKID